MAIPLMSRPPLPSSKREGRMGSLARRFLNMQPMTMRLEEMMARPDREMMMLKAMEEPMIMRLNSDEHMSVAITAFKGMSQPGRTCKEC